MLKSITLSFCVAVSLVMVTMFMVEETRYSLPFKTYYSSLTPDARQEVECLAENIYFESAMEPKEGKLAVAFVTMNRLKSGKFADSICGVVKQKVGNTYQFSWVGEKFKSVTNKYQWDESVFVARKALTEPSLTPFATSAFTAKSTANPLAMPPKSRQRGRNELILSSSIK